MYGAMNTIGLPGFSILWALHIFSVVAFFTGIALFVVLAAKHFNQKQLKNWIIWLLVLGTVVCLGTIVAMGHPWGAFGENGQMQQFMMQNSRGSMMR